MDMKNLKVGDKVRVISEEEVKKHKELSWGSYKFDGNNFTKDMLKYCDKIVTIFDDYRKDSYGYLIKEDDGEMYYTYDMFEPIDELDSDTLIYPTDTKDYNLVSNPSHYQLKNGLKVIQVIEAFTEGFNGIDAVDIGNAVKYLGRLGKKDDTIQDAEKAAWYLNHFIERNKGE